MPYFIKLYQDTTCPTCPIRKISVTFNEVIDEIYEQYDLFTDSEEAKKDAKLQKTIVDIKKKYGKSSIIRGMNLEEGATTLKRHKLIGGHNGG